MGTIRTPIFPRAMEELYNGKTCKTLHDPHLSGGCGLAGIRPLPVSEPAHGLCAVRGDLHCRLCGRQGHLPGQALPDARPGRGEKGREEREAAERKRKIAEEKRSIEEALKNAKIHRIPLSNLQMVVDENDSFSDQMTAIAGNANMSFLCRNNREFQNSIIKLYNKVHGHNSYKLRTIAAKDGQCIGLAFIKMALYFDNGDFQVNEIAAQNAFYCIYKNYKETGNTYVLPAIFTLLLKKPRALEDELYRSNPDPELVGFGGMTLSAPYIRSDRAMVNRLPIMKFLLQSFYDEGSKKFTIDTTLPYHIPSEEEVVKFTNEYVQSQYANKKESISIGEEYFNDMFEDINDQLDV